MALHLSWLWGFLKLERYHKSLCLLPYNMLITPCKLYRIQHSPLGDGTDLRMARETFCFQGLSLRIPMPKPERKNNSPVVTRSHFCDASNSSTAESQMNAWSLLWERLIIKLNDTRHEFMGSQQNLLSLLFVYIFDLKKNYLHVSVRTPFPRRPVKLVKIHCCALQPCLV